MKISFKNIDLSKKELLIIFFSAFIGITLFSKSSFFYPLNDWCDANCFLTVGKSLVAGKVLYRDIYEQKGPMLYFFHSICSLISRTSFFGVYLLEVLCAFLFLLFSYKTVKLFITENNNKFIKAIYFMPILSLIIYSQSAFCHGDSCEELSLPFLAYTIYIGFKHIIGKNPPTKKESVLVGVCASIVFWMKFTLVGLFVPWFIGLAIMLIRKKEYKELTKLASNVVFGLFLGSLPVLIYFMITNSFSYLWEAYFYNNLFLYSGIENPESKFAILSHIKKGFINTFRTYYSLIIPSLITLAYLLLKNKKLCAYLFFMILFAGTFAFVGRDQYVYYNFIYAVFIPLVAIPFLECNFKLKSESKKILYTSVFSILMVYCFAKCGNTSMFLEKKENLPQYKFKEIICKEENPTLLNYSFLDFGFFTTCDIVPSNRFFCKLNFTWDVMKNDLNNAVKNKLTTFVVTRGSELKNDNYELVATEKYPYEGKERTYRLYKVKGE